MNGGRYDPDEVVFQIVRPLVCDLDDALRDPLERWGIPSRIRARVKPAMDALRVREVARTNTRRDRQHMSVYIALQHAEEAVERLKAHRRYAEQDHTLPMLQPAIVSLSSALIVLLELVKESER